MGKKRKVEIFSAGCSVCQDIIRQVRDLACEHCEVVEVDMHDDAVAARARAYGITSVPAVVVDGELAPCCAKAAIDTDVLRRLGVGQPLDA